MNMLETKIPPPLLAFTIGLAMWFLTPVSSFSEEYAWMRQVVGPIVVLLGLACGLLGAASFRKAKTMANPMTPEQSTALVNTGIYKYSRNPMYLGTALLLLAWAIYLASAWALLGVVAFVHYMNRFQIIPEERAMEKRFGQAYLAYKAKVRRWL